MDWVAWVTNIIARIPVERVLFPPPDNTKALEDFIISMSATQSAKGASVSEKPTSTITRPFPRPELPTPEETTTELKRRLGKELYRAELDLSSKLRIAGKPCDCLEAKHTLGLEAAAEELIAQEPTNPVYSEILQWIKNNHPKVTIEAIVSGKYDLEYPQMAAEFKDFRKRIMGSTSLTAMIKPKEEVTLEEAKKLASEEAAREVEARWPSQQGNPTGNPVSLVGVAPRPVRPEEAMEREEEKLERRRRGLKPGTRYELTTPEQGEQIRRLRAQGLKMGEIAARVGRSLTTVWNVLHRGRPPLRRAITKERFDEVMSLRRQGLTYEEIGYRIGLTRPMCLYILKRAGESVDPRKSAEELQEKLLAMNNILRAPATIPKLTDAANKALEIYEDAELLLEIAPHIPYMGPQPYNIGFKAALAEEVLRTGVWCMQEKLKGFEVREIPRVGIREVPISAERKEVLDTCGESARDAAQGMITDKPGYETKSTQFLWLLDEMMEEAEVEAKPLTPEERKEVAGKIAEWVKERV